MISPLTPAEFEIYVGDLFRQQGYGVEHTGGPNDGGVDLRILDKHGALSVVQCKYYHGAVGPAAVRDLYGTMMSEAADTGYLVTTGGFTQAARRFAYGKPIQLVNGTELAPWSNTRRRWPGTGQRKPRTARRAWRFARWLFKISWLSFRVSMYATGQVFVAIGRVMIALSDSMTRVPSHAGAWAEPEATPDAPIAPRSGQHTESPRPPENAIHVPRWKTLDYWLGRSPKDRE